MKTIQKLFVICGLLACGSLANAQVTGPPVATNNLPDLIVKDIIFESAPEKIRVKVLNQGGSASGLCYLALSSGAAKDVTKTAKRVWTIEVPPLAAGKEFSNIIDVSPLTQTQGPWKALIDRSDKVKESNESNNQKDYLAFGGSVNIYQPDLQVTGAVLLDATSGEVSVEISNTEPVEANASVLRLIVWEMGKVGKKSTKTVFVDVPAIGPSAKTTVKVTAGVPIVSTTYWLYIDISNDVTEKNEKNNFYKGEAGKS